MKISQLTDGASPQDTDEFVAARSGGNVKLAWADMAEAAGSLPSQWTTNDDGDLTIAPDTAASGDVPLEVLAAADNTENGPIAHFAGHDGDSGFGFFIEGSEIWMSDGAGQQILNMWKNSGLVVSPTSNGMDGGPALRVLPGNAFTGDLVSVSLAAGGEAFKIAADGTALIVLPTSDPGVAGALWNDGGTVAISAGP